MQNEGRVLSVEDRTELVNRLSASGVGLIEVASFVNPKLVPQMDHPEDVLAAIHRRPDERYAALVLNESGARRAIDAGVDLIRFVVPASSTFGLRNQRMDGAAAVAEFARAAAIARSASRRCVAVIAVAFGCPFEGPVKPSTVVGLAKDLSRLGADEIVLADTIGVAIPDQVSRIFAAVRDSTPGVELGGHFHNTRNSGLANCLAAADAGASVLDSSVGGTGGCPFAPRASGNVPTEDLVYMLGDRLDRRVDLRALISTAEWLQVQLGRQLPGMLMKAGIPDDVPNLTQM